MSLLILKDVLENIYAGVRLTLRLKIGKMMLEEIQPEVFPSIAQYEGTKSQNSLTSVDGPSHTRFFHPCADQVLAGGFHYPTAYW